VSDLLVWIDCEMTGLDLRRDLLIEVAVVVTGADLIPVDSGLDVIIKVPDEALDGMIAVVRDMHDKSGLTTSVRAATTTLSQAEDQVLEYVQKHVPEPRTAPLCGNSIATDRGFIMRDMPRLDAHLHYRMIDVSSVKELCRRWYPRAYFGQQSKGLSHRALVDIMESIRELEFYRRAIFVPPPGPDVESAKAIAAGIVAEQARASGAGAPVTATDA
jgi:oligoribonuclease